MYWLFLIGKLGKLLEENEIDLVTKGVRNGHNGFAIHCIVEAVVTIFISGLPKWFSIISYKQCNSFPIAQRHSNLPAPSDFPGYENFTRHKTALLVDLQV